MRTKHYLLQGPDAAKVLKNLGLNLDGFHFMDVRHFDLAGNPLVISRSGYTGEDGFEISIPGESVTPIAERLLNTKKVTLAGLGARDIKA